MRRHIIAMLAILAYCAPCGATRPVEERWSDEVVGEAWLEDMTPEQGRKLCLARAKARAIEQVAGVKILSETLVSNTVLVADLVRARSQAWVKAVKNERWSTEQVRRGGDEPPQLLYRVRLKALVAVDRNRDRGFSLRLDLNRSTYEAGDEMELTVQSGEDAYLTLFNILEDGRVTVLLPNRFRTERAVRKGKKVHFPDPQTMGSSRKLRLFPSSKSSVAREAILVVATTEDIDLIEGDFAEAAFREYPRQTGLFRDILEKLMEIPPNRRAMALQYYELRAKDGERPAGASRPAEDEVRE